MKAKELPPVETLREVFEYNEVTGIVTWKKGMKGHGTGAGEVAGSGKSGPYLVVKLNKQNYLLHRIIWKLVTGEDPDIIDHLNGDRRDNRLCNLRSTSTSQNNYNRTINNRNTSGHRGVSRANSMINPWLAKLGGVYLGCFNTFEEAVEARLQAEKQQEIYVKVD